MPPRLDVSIVIPTYREADNLRVLIPRLADVLREHPWTYEIIVVDDASPDTTEEVCAQLAKDHPVRLIVRRNERGLSSAVIRGMQDASGRVLVCLDADLSHPPEAVPALVAPLLSDDPGVIAGGPDFVVGSRYVSGGSTEDGWGLFRWLNSQVATLLARPLVKLRDPMAGFFALRSSDFAAHAAELNPVGYKIALELIVKCGCSRVLEIPIQFRNRLHGESKLCLREQWNYLRHLSRLYAHRFREAGYFFRFCLVGLSGVAIDLSLLALLLWLSVSHPVGAALAICGAMTWNFTWNRLWTFEQTRKRTWIVQYLQFCASCLLGGGFNWSTRVALTTWVAAFADRPFAAAGLGVLAGVVSNYLLCRLYVFQSRRHPAAESPTADDARRVSEPAAARERRRRMSRILERTFLCGLVWLVFGAAPLTADDLAVRAVADSAIPNTVPTRRPLSLDLSDSAIERRLRSDANYLASDELEGRGVRTRGLELASEFIAHEFAAAGLETKLYDGTPFHEFRLHAAGNKGAVQELVVAAPGGAAQTLSQGADYHSLMVSPKGAFQLPMAFVGYGITDPENNYDDYEGLNVAGKAVVVLRHEPLGLAPNSKEGDEPRKAAYVLTKIRNAIVHGAAAVIVVTDARELARQAHQDEAEPLPEPPETLLDVEFNTGVGTETLPAVHCRRRIVAEWIRAVAGRELDAIEADIEKSRRPASFELTGFTVAGRVAVSRSGWTLRNVVGTLPGAGKHAEEALVVGAHYDHLGRGGWGSLAAGVTDVIHNGADDNASGTAVLLEVARQLSALPTPLNRRVIVIAFSAEELGLIGSRRYVQSPLVPLSQTVAMLNLDMVGRLRNDKLTVYGTGTAVEWPNWLGDAASRQQLLINPRPSGFGPSDHASFYDRGIPVLHFFTGFHPEYHRPGDDADRLNITGMRKIAGVLTDLIRQIDAAPSRPRMRVVDEASILASLGDVGTISGREQESGPRLGVILDLTEQPVGVRIRQLIRFSPAEQAGLRPGDVILKLDDQAMSAAEDVQKYVGSRRRGQSISVEFDRKGTRRQIELAL